MALIIKGRISYTRDDGGPVLDLTKYNLERSAPSLSWRDEAAFCEWVQQRLKEIEEEGGHEET